jgi:hypothetical protein
VQPGMIPQQNPTTANVAPNQPVAPEAAPKKKPGFFKRLFGGKKDEDQQQQQPAQPQAQPQ